MQQAVRPLPALGTPRYLPREADNALKQIVEDHLEELQRVYDERFRSTHGALSPRVIGLFERFIKCGDYHFGFARMRCEDCGDETVRPFSCKSRGLCPSCCQRRAIEWSDRMVEDVLPEVPYAPLVFTIPKMLRPAFLFDRRLYGDLCRGAYQVVREHLQAQFPDIARAVPAFVASPQSFGGLLNPHPHAHALASHGVFDEQGEFHEATALNFGQLELPFRDAILKAHLHRGTIDEERAELILSWPHSGFRVHSERLIAPGAKAELESILQYMERCPVSLRKLTYLDTGMVLYQGRYHPGLGTDHRLVTGVEFLAMLVPHVALRYEMKMRLYGAVSTTHRKRWGWIQDEEPPAPASDGTPEDSGAAVDPIADDQEESPFTRARRRRWAQLIRKVWRSDPEECSKCGGPVKVVSIITSPHQDDVIRAILTSQGRWNPPWSRQRSPPSAANGEDRFDDPHIEYEIHPDQIWPDD